MRQSTLLLLSIFLCCAGVAPVSGQTYPPLLLEVASTSAQPGEEVCLDFRASNFQAILSIQFSIEWDTAVLRFIKPTDSGFPEIPDNSLTSNFGINSPFTKEGKIGFSYLAGDLINGTTLPDSSVLFRLCYEVIGPEGSSSPVNITGFPTELEVIQEEPTGTVERYELSIAGATVVIGQQKAPPPLHVDIFDGRCEGEAPGFLEARPRGGTPPYTYLWTGPEEAISDEAVLPDPSPGRYRIDVIDDRGATAITQQELTQAPNSIILSSETGCTFTENGSYVPFAQIQAAGGEAPYQIDWSTGSSTINDSMSRLQVEEAGIYYATVTDAAGCRRIDTVEVAPCPDNIAWPGDANADGRADGRDLLTLGIANSASGPPRPDAALDWLAQAAPLWNEQTPQSNINFLHSDSDGNGRIEAPDTLGLSKNWGKTNEKYVEVRHPDIPPPSRSDNPPLYLATRRLAPGESGVFDIILGESERTAEGVYGLSLQLFYDSPYLETEKLRVSFPNSWVGTIGTDTWAMQHHAPEERRIDIAITGTNRRNRYGAGAVGQLNIRVSPDAPEHDIQFRIEQAWLIDSAEQRLAVAPMESLAEVRQTTARSRSYLPSPLMVYPNPAREQLFLKTGTASIQQVDLFSTGGRFLRRWENTNPINIQGIRPGMYWLQILTTKGRVNRKIVVMP